MSPQAQPLTGKLPPPPPGFTPEASQNQPPPPPPGFTPEAASEQKPPAEETGIWAGVKRNTVGAAQGLYHAVTDPATEEEQQHFKDLAAKEGAPPHDPSAPELAYHRLVEKPSDEVSAEGSKYFAAGKQDLGQGNFWRGVNEYLSGATNKALSAVPMAGPWINSIAKRAESGDVTGAATDVAFGKAAEHAPAIVGKAGEVTGKALRNETGNLRPGAREASRAVGWMAGHYSGIPGADIAGALGAPALLETLTPSREPTVADAVPITQSPYYTQNKAKLDAAAAEEAESRKPVPVNQSPYWAQNQAKIAEDAASRKAVPITESPYHIQNQERLAAAVEDRKPVPVSQSPYFNQNKAKLAAAGDAEKAAAEADAEARKPVPVTQSPYYNQNRIKTTAQAKEARAAVISRQIVAPDSSGGPRFVGSEGRAATWTNERVMQLAKEGNREAIQQAVRRGMELPPNARYVAGDPSFSSSVYNPRDVTVFAPDGTPIRQGGKVTPLAKPFSGAAQTEPVTSNAGGKSSAKETREQYIRPPERPSGAGTGEPPAVMHAEELAEIRRETGQRDLSIVDAQRYRIQKMARTAAESRPSNELGGMKRAGDSKPAVPLHAAKPKAPYLGSEQ